MYSDSLRVYRPDDPEDDICWPEPSSQYSDPAFILGIGCDLRSAVLGLCFLPLSGCSSADTPASPRLSSA